VEVGVGPPIDTVKGAGGEQKARLFAVYGYVPGPETGLN
jgi:hypothetical protein